MPNRTLSRPAVCAALFVASTFTSAGAGITLIQRESRAENTLFAGSGGAVDQFNEELLLQDPLLGPFAFASNGAVSVVKGGVSNGSGEAFGTIEAADLVEFNDETVITIHSSRNSIGSAEYFSGTANAIFTLASETRLRFQTDEPLYYEITGSFHPDAEAGNAFLQLNRPFTTLTFFNFVEAQDVDQSGIMPANNTYQFRVHVSDSKGANAGTHEVEGTSAYDVAITIAPIACAADLNQNGFVELGDLNLILANFGQNGSAGDATRDGVVNLEDLNLLLAQFSQPCPIER